MAEKDLNNGSGELEQQHSFEDEHNYDGIEELNNPPPRWIMALFYITIGFSILYAAKFFWLDAGPTQDELYVRKSAAHDVKYGMNTQGDGAMVLLTSAEDLEAGKQIYTQMNCNTCHGELGEGNAIGPNLTDNAWIHGCDIESVFNIVKNGEPSKGMTAFKGQMSDASILQVSSYVLSLVGSDPPNARDAQGELCE